MIKATYALVGEVAYKVPDEAVADKIMKVGIYPVGTGVQISREALNTDGTLNYTKLITYLTENAARNQLIADSIERRPSLILSDRLNHLETLISLLPADMQKDAVMISGKMTTKKGKAEREQALEDMRSGKKKYLFATYSLCKEGLDIPRLERLYMASPVKDYTVVVQSIGRIARTFEGKAEPICYDFVDDIAYLVKSYKKRWSHYKKVGCYFYKSTRHFPACSHNFPKAGEARFQGLSRLFRLLGKFPYLGESRRILMAVSSKTSSKTRFYYAATRRISSAAVQPSIWA